VEIEAIDFRKCYRMLCDKIISEHLLPKQVEALDRSNNDKMLWLITTPGKTGQNFFDQIFKYSGMKRLYLHRKLTDLTKGESLNELKETALIPVFDYLNNFYPGDYEDFRNPTIKASELYQQFISNHRQTIIKSPTISTDLAKKNSLSIGLGEINSNVRPTPVSPPLTMTSVKTSTEDHAKFDVGLHYKSLEMYDVVKQMQFAAHLELLEDIVYNIKSERSRLFYNDNSNIISSLIVLFFTTFRTSEIAIALIFWSAPLRFTKWKNSQWRFFHSMHEKVYKIASTNSINTLDVQYQINNENVLCATAKVFVKHLILDFTRTYRYKDVATVEGVEVSLMKQIPGVFFIEPKLLMIMWFYEDALNGRNEDLDYPGSYYNGEVYSEQGHAKIFSNDDSEYIDIEYMPMNEESRFYTVNLELLHGRWGITGVEVSNS
jgi:hypothetical protein